MLLLMNCFQTKKPIPSGRLASVARLSNERWTIVEQTLKEFFEQDDNGNWFNRRIQKELERIENKAKKASEAGKKSAEKRAKRDSEKIKIPTGDEQTLSERLAQNKQPLNQKEKEKEREKERDIDIHVKRKRSTKPDSWKTFFANYPDDKKGGRDDSAWKKAKSLKLTDDDFELMIKDLDQRRALQPSWYQTYAPGICKYLDDHIWKTPVKPDQLDTGIVPVMDFVSGAEKLL